MIVICRNCQSPLAVDRFCDRCGAQEAFPPGPEAAPERLAALYDLLQEVRQTGVAADGGEVTAAGQDDDAYVRMLMVAIRGSEQDFIAAGGVKFLGAAIPEETHPMRDVIARLTAGRPVVVEEMEAAMARFAEVRATLPVEQRFTRPLAELDDILRRLTGLRIALTPMAEHVQEPGQREFVLVQQLGVDRRIAAVSVEMEMLRRGHETESAVG